MKKYAICRLRDRKTVLWGGFLRKSPNFASNQTQFSMKTRLIFLLLFSVTLCAQSQQSLIPRPESCVLGSGTFVLGDNPVVECADAGLRGMADSLQAQLRSLGFPGGQKSGQITCRVQNSVEGQDESYRIVVKENKVMLEASSRTGLFRAGQTFLQMLRAGNGKVRACRIDDAPRYGWRGFMVDESRHFFGKEKILQYLDIMAALKMNVFHWHLTDEPGWRIEIKRYPKLTAQGAVGNWHDAGAPARFYTQDDIREIVAYAQARHIMVVPEFDMPGHATAVCRAYPEVSGGGEGRWKHFTFHPCKAETYDFIGNILDELFRLFPSPYIHIGGDEVHFGNQTWFTDAEIQRFIEENKLVNETGLEHYFLRRVADMVARKGRKVIVWDEAIDAGISPEKAVIMWWRHDRKHQLLKALEKGYRVIMTPRRPLYADFNQDASHKYGRVWDGYNALENVYAFPEPVLHLARGYEKQLMGLQMSLWTERIADTKRLDYMAFPRLAAVAEDAWTPETGKDFSRFMQRLPLFLDYLDGLGVYYYNPFNPSATPEPAGPQKAAAEQ